MSDRSGPMSETELDRILRAFAREAIDAPAQRITDAAMAQIQSTSQVRRPFVVRRPFRARFAPIWAVAVIAAVVAGVGVYLVAAPPGPAHPSTTPTPSVSPSTAVPATKRVGGPADGFELTVPASWTALHLGYADARMWVGAEGSVMVSYGSSIFDGGSVTQCGPPTPEFARCQTETYTYSVPYQPALDGIGPLEIAGYVRDRCVGGCDLAVGQETLGGERAQRVSTIAAGARATYVATFHDRRPVIVYWSEPESTPDPSPLVDEMVASFHFIDAPVSSPTPFVDPTELVPYVNSEVGYEILVPRFWGAGTDPAPTVHAFGSGRGFGTRGSPALTVSVGSTKGAITICQTPTGCDDVVVKQLADLEAALISAPEDMPLREVSGDLELAGSHGGFKHPEQSGNCLGCPRMVYHAYAIVSGRPVVISIDWWTIHFGTLPGAYIEDILSSFRLLD